MDYMLRIRFAKVKNPEFSSEESPQNFAPVKISSCTVSVVLTKTKMHFSKAQNQLVSKTKTKINAALVR